MSSSERKRKSGGSLRLFVGLYPPPDSCDAMLKTIGGFDLAAGKETPINQIHMTVQFIGDVHARELEAVEESVGRSVSGLGAFELAPARLITLPERGRPRLVTMTTNLPDTLAEIHRRLAHRLAKHPRVKREDRFLPHITLFRFRHDAQPGQLDAPIDAAVAPFTVSEIRLMRSILRPTGAEHALQREYALAR